MACGCDQPIVIITDCNFNFVRILLDGVQWRVWRGDLFMEIRGLEFDVKVSTEPPIGFQRLQEFEQGR